MICFDSVISINKKCFIFLPALCLQGHFISGRPFLWHLHSRLYFHFTFHNLIQGQPLVRCNSVACCLTWSISQFVLSLIFDDRLHGNLMPLYNLYNVSKHYLNFVISPRLSKNTCEHDATYSWYIFAHKTETFSEYKFIDVAL